MHAGRGTPSVLHAQLAGGQLLCASCVTFSVLKHQRLAHEHHLQSPGTSHVICGSNLQLGNELPMQGLPGLRLTLDTQTQLLEPEVGHCKVSRCCREQASSLCGHGCCCLVSRYQGLQMPAGAVDWKAVHYGPSCAFCALISSRLLCVYVGELQISQLQSLAAHTSCPHADMRPACCALP